MMENWLDFSLRKSFPSLSLPRSLVFGLTIVLQATILAAMDPRSAADDPLCGVARKTIPEVASKMGV